MGWDASRVSAAIPSGVGFLGAGLIFKKEETSPLGESNHVVHGLTTAASVWLSAAVGIACGGDLYMPASFGVAIMMLLLRFGPRGNEGDEGGSRVMEYDEEQLEKIDEEDREVRKSIRIFDQLIPSIRPLDGDGNRPLADYASITNLHDEGASLTGSFRGTMSTRAGGEGSSTEVYKRAASIRRRQAALGSMV